jgi:hypothetical protein
MHEDSNALGDNVIAKAARTAWINWRMRDVPTIYYGEIPETNDAKTLWEAEQSIRRRMIVDMELMQSPWRRVGQGNDILFDRARLTAGEWETILEDLQVVPVGCVDGPKEGREGEVRDDIAIQQAGSMEFKVWCDFLDRQRAERDQKEERMRIFGFDPDQNSYSQFLAYLAERESRRFQKGFDDYGLRAEMGVITASGFDPIYADFKPVFVDALIAEHLKRKAMYET